MHDITLQQLAEQVTKTRYYQKAYKLAKGAMCTSGTKSAAKSAGSALIMANAHENVLDAMTEQVLLTGGEVSG